MASSSTNSSRMDVSGRANKRTRYSSGSHFSSRMRQKAKFWGPYLSFESEKLKPVLRGTIDVDSRFLPYGISPGMILEIKGPEKSGKTFLLTYFLARMLTVYPEKKAVLINTRHKFNMKNYLSIVRTFDADLKNAQLDLSLPVEDLISSCPKLATYLERLLVIPCYSAEDLLLTLGPADADESVVQKLLLDDPSVSLVAIDSIDIYSFAESLQEGWTEQWSSIMESLRESVSQTKCPVICTTLIPANAYEYKKKTIPRKLTPSSSGGEQRHDEDPSTQGALPTTENRTNANYGGDNEEGNIQIQSNFPIDYSVFTTILEIVLASKAEREKSVHLTVNKANHYAYAYLRSRHNANTAGSGVNHRVRFSIFSDMLWVGETWFQTETFKTNFT